jgi:hypothetical protein
MLQLIGDMLTEVTKLKINKLKKLKEKINKNI